MSYFALNIHKLMCQFMKQKVNKNASACQASQPLGKSGVQRKNVSKWGSHQT